jgi:ACS family allantoate permease-like MFS transporter
MTADKAYKPHLPNQDLDAKMGETLSLQGSIQVAEEDVDNRARGRKVLRRIDIWYVETSILWMRIA